jgi:hypothetical protein
MIRIRQMRLAQYVAVVLLLAMYVFPSVGMARGKAKTTEMPPAKTIVIFPFDNTTKSSVETLSKDIQQSMQNALSEAGGYRVYAFSEQLPSVQRALLETTLKKDDLKGPFGTEKEQIATALKIGREMAADLILVGTIDDAKVDTEKHTGVIALTAVVVDVKTGEPKTIGVAGAVPANSTVTTEAGLIGLASDDAVGRLVKVIVPQPIVKPEQRAEVPSKHKSSFKKIVVGLLLGAAVGLAVANRSSGSSEGTDNPPPPP